MPGIAIFGVTGRMGQALVRALREVVPGKVLPGREGLAEGLAGINWRLSGAIASPGSSRLGADAALDGAPCGVPITADAAAGLVGAAVAVDFSLAACVADNARACARAGVPLLVGATGFDEMARDALEAAAALIPVLIAPNTSLGVNVVAELVRRATLALGPGYDVEIGEAHHRFKRDAPSGTALALGEIVAGARGKKLADIAAFTRHNNLAPRSADEIGFSVVRAGDIVGEHTVSFATAGERVEITHRVTDRVTFARGALRAAEWLSQRGPGLYGMQHVVATAIDSDGRDV